MSDGEIFKAEIVHIKDSVEGGGAVRVTHPEAKLEKKPEPDHVRLRQTSGSLSARSENTPPQQAAGTHSMETAANKHGGISRQPCPDPFGRPEVSSGFFSAKASESEDRRSPVDSAGASPTLASSRESILSEGWCGALPPSSVTSPASLSRTVSPCSSVRSGAFTPSVVQIRRHFLAPGSSLLHTPQTCFSSCESLSSSVCLSPPPRHRPPLTRLSLLTAILRKGRLPVLSSPLQRPYTPCWPINPVTLSFCNACSAASSVASIPLELSSKFSSSVSIDSQSHREPTPRCVTAPPPAEPTGAKRCSEPVRPRSAPRWERVVSPLAARTPPPPPALPPLFCSKLERVTPADHEEKQDCVKSCNKTQLHKSEPPQLKLSNGYAKGHGDPRNLNPHARDISFNEQEKNLDRQPGSLSKLRWLSQQLRAPSRGPPRPASASTRPETDSPLPLPPPSWSAVGRCELESTATPTRGLHKAHALSPSCYTPIVFSGWPSPASTPTPTPTPTPYRDFSPSPSLSLRSTPSPRPGSNCSDIEGKKRKTHRIKSSYKSLAAIPTNTLLLDQQVIDEQVERGDGLCDAPGRGLTPQGGDTDTHAEMCSPAQLRQQSEDLYAAIDEILANSIPVSRTSSRTPTPTNNSSFSKSLGRETKYASVGSLHPSAGWERQLFDPKKTKPGVIRPTTAIPMLTVEDEEFHHNPFRQFVVKQPLTGSKTVDNKTWEETGINGYSANKGQMLRKDGKPERGTAVSACDLQITEAEDLITRPGKEAVTSFSSTAGQMEAFETHI